MTIQSPNFPGPYPARTICRYVVRRYDSATCALEVLFTRFDMEHNPDCQYEHLQVDGRKLCGTLPENSVREYRCPLTTLCLHMLFYFTTALAVLA
ncbi:hypothetical protein V5799_025028 [Amblyomma americanum]|uniref:CUB domain-containing protein n=1 Tax=Amblyomma americanum TaxID=6943 RepID=A0AAQ4EAC9_AMBAM